MGGLKRLVPDCLQHRLVILVYENHHTLACRFGGTTDDSLEPLGGCHLVFLFPIAFLPLGKGEVQTLRKDILVLVVVRVQVEVQDGAGRPVRLQLLHRQPAEQLAPAGEVGLEGGNEQALAETARAAEEVVSSLHDQLMNHGRLVHVGVTVLAQTFKVLYSDRVFHRLFLPGLVDTANLHKNCDL